MSKKLYEENDIQAVADAIRFVNGAVSSYMLKQMAGAIRSLKKILEPATFSSNGTYSPASGIDGFSQVIVNVPNTYSMSDEGKVVKNGALVSQSSLSITDNGTYDTTEKNTVIVNVESGGSGILIEKTITANGTYVALDDTADGYSQVIVNVQGGGNRSPRCDQIADFAWSAVMDGSMTWQSIAILTE